MMAVEGPFLTSLTARLDNPKENLAAFGVAFSLAWLFEAPIVMMMTASLRLVKSRQNLLFLKKFNYTLCAIISLTFLIAVTPSGWQLLSKTILSLSDNISNIAWNAIVVLLPWPALIGYRRFYQGILISHGKSKFLLYGTIIRVCAMLLFAFLGSQIDFLVGIQKVTVALTGGVLAEAIAARILVRPYIENLMKVETNEDYEALNYTEVVNFYYPLALTAMMSIAIQPLITASVNYGEFPLKSLAVLPVVNAFIFIFKCFPLSLQEAYISLIEKNESNFKKLSKYTFVIILSLSLFLTLVVVTPLYKVWFSKVNGLSTELVTFARASLAVIIWHPIISVFHSFNRSAAIHYKKTKFISNATLLELGFILLSLVILVPSDWFSGIFAAMSALLIGRIVSALYLFVKVKRLQTLPSNLH